MGKGPGAKKSGFLGKRLLQYVIGRQDYVFSMLTEGKKQLTDKGALAWAFDANANGTIALLGAITLFVQPGECWGCCSLGLVYVGGQSKGLLGCCCNGCKDFSESRNNRFSTPEQAAKNRIQHPSNVLHFFNAPLEVTEENFFEICDELGVKRPSSVKVFSGKSERSSSGLLEWESKSDALETLGFLNHYQMKNPNGPYPYTLKLCFSTAQHAS
ncbi:heterogeneous nuclear ribonucleoprotein L-like [Mirounga leonina]|uniref:heterogeneous nuclear ribonucleoprotein L-like n=1 Tax=Mirounga leonina TaxID=9715 RepID=UPI00156C4AB9|nr:heterogeneous nuclear ribonucleoprotein L-like [Mirounga leonina]KAF3814045.1 hypothetical protein GH733_018077 [Mirounga leonina]